MPESSASTSPRLSESCRSSPIPKIAMSPAKPSASALPRRSVNGLAQHEHLEQRAPHRRHVEQQDRPRHLRGGEARGVEGVVDADEGRDPEQADQVAPRQTRAPSATPATAAMRRWRRPPASPTAPSPHDARSRAAGTQVSPDRIAPTSSPVVTTKGRVWDDKPDTWCAGIGPASSRQRRGASIAAGYTEHPRNHGSPRTA